MDILSILKNTGISFCVAVLILFAFVQNISASKYHDKYLESLAENARIKSELSSAYIKIDEQNNSIAEMQKSSELIKKKLNAVEENIIKSREIQQKKIDYFLSDKVGNTCMDAIKWGIDRKKDLL